MTWPSDIVSVESIGTRPSISQFQSLHIGRSSFLSNEKFLTWNCEKYSVRNCCCFLDTGWWPKTNKASWVLCYRFLKKRKKKIDFSPTYTNLAKSSISCLINSQALIFFTFRFFAETNTVFVFCFFTRKFRIELFVLWKERQKEGRIKKRKDEWRKRRKRKNKSGIYWFSCCSSNLLIATFLL